MQCRCGRKAIYHRRFSGEFLCGSCLSKSVEKIFRKTIRKYKMIRKGERVAVGVSGGKDSLALSHLLSKLKERLPFTFEALMIDEGIYGYRDHTIEKAVKSLNALGISYKIFSFQKEFGFLLDEVESKVSKCSYCGVLRRYILNKKARELGFSKLAVGHNLDDEVQTILMNLLRGDFSRFSRTGYRYRKVHEKFVPRIKPLRGIPEKEVYLYALVNEVDFDESICPYATEAYREDVRNFLNYMESKRPSTKYTLLKSYDELFPYLEALTPKRISTCAKCGEPSISDECKACLMLEELSR
ncbi:MAG: TIGR00269 family protein [Candidatus Methanofastidiosia archaeon]